jgi:Domain of unknown function(DUF2779)
VHARRRALRQFLAKLKFPLHFLDFETINPAIPIWDESKPFEQIPFQYSLHILENWGATPLHYSYLSEGRNDPRPEMMHRLTRFVRPVGSILAYNASFERMVLNRCCSVFQEFGSWWKLTQNRFVDLLQPFRNFDYYSPMQHGSASMKSVLPALCGMGYGDLSIQDGTAASRAFLRATFDEVNPEERQRLRAHLETYCARDTLGMVLVLRNLKCLVES